MPEREPGKKSKRKEKNRSKDHVEKPNRLLYASRRSATLQRSESIKRGILMAAGIAVIAGGLVLNNARSNDQIIQTPLIAPTAKAVRTPTVKNNTDFARFYPEVLDKYPVLSQGEFHGNYGRVRWLNFTETTLNEEALRGMYEYFDNLSRQDALLTYQDGVTNILFGFQPMPFQDRTLFIVPENAPNPWWSPNATPRQKPASTYYGTGEKDLASFIRIFRDRNNSLIQDLSYEANHSLAVEVCQQTVRVGINRDNPTFLAQEIICNSFGRAFYDGQRDKSYQQYQSGIINQTIGSPDSSRRYRYYDLGPSKFNDILKTGLVLN